MFICQFISKKKIKCRSECIENSLFCKMHDYQINTICKCKTDEICKLHPKNNNLICENKTEYCIENLNTEKFNCRLFGILEFPEIFFETFKNLTENFNEKQINDEHILKSILILCSSLSGGDKNFAIITDDNIIFQGCNENNDIELKTSRKISFIENSESINSKFVKLMVKVFLELN